ncbi:MAG: GreA/GreB family elongation factor [Bacteroidales bacterium]|nr:GreA/GreB family elongation factor [Bacteroidales bacterium]
MSRGFVKEGDQEEIPMVPPRAYLPKGMPNYVTKEGIAALNKERENLEDERVAASGNYIMSNFIDAKMKLLIERINTAVEVDLTKANKETVSFGAYVKYNDRTVRIVGVDEADFSKGLLSFISPVAKALVGKKVGDKFEIKVPKGTETVEVQGIWYEAVPLTKAAVETNDDDKSSLGTLITSRTRMVSEIKAIAASDSNDATINQEEVPRADGARNDGGAVDDIFVPENDIMEFLPVVNERGIIVGRALHMELHKGNKILHPVLHLHVINDNGEDVRRYWWHVAFGDTPEKTLKRKMQETLGLTAVKPKQKKQFIRETKTEKELVYVYFLNSDENLLKTPEDKEYFDIFAKD